MAKKHGALRAVADINVTPMVDVMLVLLIIFMVVTPLMIHRGVGLDLAKASNPRDMRSADKEDAAVIAITRDGRIYLGSDPVAPDQITGKLKDLLSNKPDKTVYVKSDGRARYGIVVSVVDNVRAAGVDSLGLLTEKRQGANAAPPLSPAS